MKYIIVGSGLTGCVFAEQLAQNPDNMIYMVEKKRHIGGTCYDHYNKEGILIHEYGPHIFNTPDQEVWDYVNKFTPVIQYFHRVLGYVDGELVPIPFNIKSIAFPKLGCGLGGLDWKEVMPLIEHYLSKLDIDVEIYVQV